MFTYGYSKIALPGEGNVTTQGTARTLSMISFFVLSIALYTSRRTPENLHVLYHSFTPSGLLVVADYHGTVPPVRYLRHDASVVGVSEIVDATSPEVHVDKKSAVYRLSTIEAINDAVRLAHSSKGNNALVL